MFRKTVWGYGHRTKSIHGYLPDYREKDGVFVTNLQTKNGEYLSLADITPSILDLFDQKNEYKFDGDSIWG